MKTRPTDFEKRYRLAREVVETIALTVLLFLVIRLAVQNFNIDGMSMEPNLHDQELVLVDKWSYLFHAPSRGDIVVFHAPPHPNQDYVKRIIGMPGDVVTIQDTTVIVNGMPLKESYIDPGRQGNPYASFVDRLVPSDSYLVLGDNRAGSSDSRDWGCVPRKNIIGKAALVYWPLGSNNLGLLPSVSSVYARIPLPSRALVSTAAASDVCPIMNNTSDENQITASARQERGGDMLSSGVAGDMTFLPLVPDLFVLLGAASPALWQRREDGWKNAARNIRGNRRRDGDGYT